MISLPSDIPGAYNEYIDIILVSKIFGSILLSEFSDKILLLLRIQIRSLFFEARDHRFSAASPFSSQNFCGKVRAKRVR